MKTTITIRLTGLALVLMFCISEITAQDTSVVAVDTTPAAVDTLPLPTPAAAPTPAPAPAPTTAPAATTEPKPEKAKKDGFNSHTRFGIRVGGIMSKQDYESGGATEDPETKFGADLAIVCAIPIGGGFFMLQPELHWMQKGYKITDADIYGDITSTLNYIEVPLLARVNFGGSVKLFAFAGPSIGYLISGTYEDDFGEKDPTDYLDDVEYSGHIGVGFGLGTLELDLRYIAGLSDISDSDNLSDVKNSSYGAGLTLKF
jgi:Outer membrane protein beta-barrel domain